MAGKRKNYRQSLIVVAGALLLSIGALGGLNLWFLRTLHRQSVHTAAAESVLAHGRTLAAYLARQPVVRLPGDPAGSWDEFGRLVGLLRQIEPAIGYVSVSEGGVILYHAQDDAPAAPGAVPPPTEIRLGRRLLGIGDRVLPVITFTAQVPGPGGEPRYVQLAVRKEAVDQEEAAAAQALTAMFRISLATIAVAFGIAVVLVAVMFRQELRREQRRRAEEHLAFAGTLADGIIHDVRNPMSSLRLDVQMLQKEAEKGTAARPERLAELADRARTTMDRVDAVMREFLYVSKPEAVARERVDVNACVQDCLDLLGPRFERLQVHVRAELAPEPMVILGYGVGLKRAVINVLTNAKQASPPGGTVHVRTRAADGAAWIEIRDEGPGIPRSDLTKVFDMFVSRRPGGVGLGLSLTRTAVESCGGTISAANAPEGGAVFTIRLPLAV